MARVHQFDETIRIMIPTDGFGAGPVSKPSKEAISPRAGTVQAKLSESEYRLYSQFMLGIYDAVIIADLAGNIVDGNGRAAEFFRCDIGELCKLGVLEIFYGFDELVLDRICRNLDKGGRFALVESYCCRRDKTLFPSEIAVSRLELGQEEHLCFFVRDITKRREAEESLRSTQAQLARSERLEMAGRIAGHIAHDFNNLLTPLLGYPGLIKEALPEGSQARKDLQVIESTAQRIAEINQQLLILSRRGHFDHKVLNINSVINNVIELVRRQTGDGIEVKLDLAEDLFNMRGAEEQLVRVIQNLYQNAIDAMGDTGTLMIKTENVYLERSPKNLGPAGSGEYVKLSIIDTGHGIPVEIKDKIFDPFFTTTDGPTRRRGAGLGLSVVHGVVEDHKGHIELDSEVGVGTMFSIYFPAERQQPDHEKEKETQVGGTETIVVVDDDQMQINVLTKILERLGYSVLAATSGEEALSIIEQCKAEGALPSLVILDMVMGNGIDGAETFQRLHEINPLQKAVFISGYAESSRVKMAQAMGGGAFLKKPVSVETLVMAVREELNKPVNPQRKEASVKRQA